MDFYKRNPIFYTLLFALLTIGLGGIWYLTEIGSELQALKRAYETKSNQYDRYLAARPSPTRSNVEALEANYAELYEVLQQTLRELNLNTYDRAAFFGATPVSRADWSFELHKFRENARDAALRQGVALPPNVQFGFEDFADGGPPPENRKSVHAQVMIMAALLDTLFASGIDSFVKIQRGRREDSPQAGPLMRRAGDRLVSEGDEFHVPPGVRSSIADTLDSYLFRVVFRGQSVALRTYLNRLTNSSLPLIIRGVEVDLASERGVRQGIDGPRENPFERTRASTSLPIISDNKSLFVVTIEFLDFVQQVEAPPPPTSDEGSEDA